MGVITMTLGSIYFPLGNPHYCVGEERFMAKKTKMTKPPTTAELATWLRSLRLHQEGALPPAGIPGLDSYVPSYSSDGAVADQRQGGGESHGQLEHHLTSCKRMR